ncbi:MAG: DsrE family protein [Reyranellales bacterium]
MRLILGFVAACALTLLINGTPRPASAQPDKSADLRIDVPVVLKEAKVVFNMDHLAFAGTSPIGLVWMKVMVEGFTANRTEWQVIAVFHSAAGYMMLNDAAYNRVRKSAGGNPFKPMIEQLQKAGVRFEECGQTARDNGWGNADLLPGVAVNSGANFRFVQLVQAGFVQLQP